MCSNNRNRLVIFALQIAILCMAVVHVICDLPPGTRRNTYLPPEPTKGYNYDTPRIPFPRPSTTRPPFSSTPPYTTRPYPSTKPNTKFPPRPTPSEGYPPTGTRPTPEFPDYGTPTRPTGSTIPPGGVSNTFFLNIYFRINCALYFIVRCPF